MAAVLFKRPLCVIQQYIDDGADINEKDNDGWTALRFAHDFKTIELLVKNGADVNTADNDGDMFVDDIFYHSVRTPNLSMLRLVLKNGATQETVQRLWSDLTENLNDESILPVALKAVKMLLKTGADINGLSCHYKKFPFRELMLNEAVRYGSLSLVEYLLKRGADPNTVDGMGCTALICCAYEAAGPKVAKMLIKAGANPYFLWRNENNPEDCHTFMDMIKEQPYYDEIAAYYEKIKKRAGK